LTIPGASSRSEPQPNAKLADARPVAKAAQAADPKSKVARTQPPKANNKKPVKAQTPNAAARSNGSKPQTASSRTQVASAGGRN
jgi:hypothetical protein